RSDSCRPRIRQMCSGRCAPGPLQSLRRRLAVWRKHIRASAFCLADIYFHVVACNSDREALHTLRCRRAEDGARLVSVLSAVPGAGNYVALDHTFCQRPASMRTGIVDRVVGATQIENSNLLSPGFDELPSIERKIVSGSDFDELGHEILLLSPLM